MNTYAKYGDYTRSENLAPSCNHAGIGLGFGLLGMAAGAAIALLFAPKSGGELRSDMRRRFDMAKSKGNDLYSNVRSKVTPIRRRAEVL
jgi:gas vesicle protein